MGHNRASFESFLVLNLKFLRTIYYQTIYIIYNQENAGGLTSNFIFLKLKIYICILQGQVFIMEKKKKKKKKIYHFLNKYIIVVCE